VNTQKETGGTKRQILGLQMLATSMLFYPGLYGLQDVSPYSRQVFQQLFLPTL
jgi:hypothetical protein